MIRSLCLSCLVGMLTAAVPSHGQGQAEQDSLERDYRDQLPRIPPKSPDEALRAFELVDGFEIELVAAEPLVTDPVAIAFDEFDRLFVVEMRGYSEHGDDRLGRVRMLTDDDGDGRYDSATTLVGDLSWPTAIACYSGGVFVAAAPDLWYFRDTDGDGRADVRRRVITGFGRGNVQGLVNSFQWGLDGRIHGAISSAGAQLQRVEPLGDPEPEPAVSLRGRDFAFDPESFMFWATGGGAQHGMCFDVWGNKFVCSNSDHIQQVLFDDDDVGRNPYLAAPGARVSIAADGPQADVFRASPVEPWRIVRTRLRTQGIVPGPVEGGGTPAGYFTGATGVTIYKGNAWPDEHRGTALVGDVGGNLVHRKRLERNGLQFVARRIDARTEFLRSTDMWFRPVQMSNGPDGQLYVIDMYREVIEHPQSLPPVIKKHLDLNSGRDRGRIYRIGHKGKRVSNPRRLGDATTSELVALLGHDNAWHRETAARLLCERRDRDALSSIRELAVSHSRPEVRIRALHTLRNLGGFAHPNRDVLSMSLRDEHPDVRRHALRLAEWSGRPGVSRRPDDVIRSAVYDLAREERIPRVRYQLAFSLGDFSGPRREETLADILKLDASDRWIRLAVFSSLNEGAGRVLEKLAYDELFMKSDLGKQVIADLVAQIGRQQRGEDVAAVADVLRRLTADGDTELTGLIVRALSARPDSMLGNVVAAATDGQATVVMNDIVRRAKRDAADMSLELTRRSRAVHLLRFADIDDDLKSLFAGLLAADQPLEVQLAAIETLGEFARPDVPRLLLDRWKGYSPQVRRRAADVLLSHPRWLRQVVVAAEERELSVAELPRDRLNALATHADPEIRGYADRLLKHVSLATRTAVLRQYQDALRREGDPDRGRLVFEKHCSQCHRLDDKGHAIGPNLAAMRNRGREAVLVNVLDPNREVNPQYLTYSVITGKGRSLTGMIAAETATSVTLQRAEDASDVVLRIDIEEMRDTGMSLMPEGLEKQIDVPSMADLLEYLDSVE